MISKVVVLLILCVAAVCVHGASVYYVDGDNGADDNSGQSAQNAFASIGKAVSTSIDADTISVQARANSVKYSGPPNSDLQIAGKSLTFVSTSAERVAVDLSAAFSFANMTSSRDIHVLLSDFDFNFGATALHVDGSVSLNVSRCTFTSATSTAVTVGGATAASTYRFVESTFTRCSGSRAGGVHIAGSPLVVSFDRCVFTLNSANGGDGGGASVVGGGAATVRFVECQFDANKASKYGGALFADSLSALSLTSCAFADNVAKEGGALAALGIGAFATLNNTFVRNNASDAEQPFQANGGALYFDSATTVATRLSSSLDTFDGNSAQANGGAIYVGDGDTSAGPSLGLTGGRFSANRAAQNGGAVYVGLYALSVSISGGGGNSHDQVVFDGNAAGGSGGGVYRARSTVVAGGASGTQPTFVLNLAALTRNSAVESGGGVYNEGGGHAAITACMFSMNSAESGGAVALSNVRAGDASSANVLTTRFESNSATLEGGAVYASQVDAATLDACTFVANTANAAGDGESGAGGAVYALDAALSLGDVNMTANVAGFTGGAIYVQHTVAATGIEARVTVASGTLARNHGGTSGGAIAAVAATVECRQCTMDSNTVLESPSSPVKRGNDAALTGAAASQATLTLVETCTLGGGVVATHAFLNSSGCAHSAFSVGDLLLRTAQIRATFDAPTVNVLGAFEWDGGSIEYSGGDVGATGSLRLQASAALSATGSDERHLAGMTLDNSGSVTLGAPSGTEAVTYSMTAGIENQRGGKLSAANGVVLATTLLENSKGAMLALNAGARIVGDLKLRGGGNFDLLVRGDGGSALEIGGHATFGGTLSLLVDGVLSAHEMSPIVYARGASGSFSSVRVVNATTLKRINVDTTLSSSSTALTVRFARHKSEPPLTGGAIAGIVISIVFFIVLAGLLSFYVVKRRHRQPISIHHGGNDDDDDDDIVTERDSLI
jgi:predicted outer membrane repeat protein